MKIAIISDTHDNIPNIDKFLKFAKENKIEVIIHCGDICKPEILQYLLDNFSGDIYAVHGNVDADYFGNKTKVNEILKQVQYDKKLYFFGEVGEVEIKGKKAAFCHLPGKARKLAESDKYDYVFYGHTHQPWQEKINACIVLNPGTLAGTFSRSTFAVLDVENDKFELKLLEKI